MNMVTITQLLSWMFTSSVIAAILTNAPKWVSDFRAGKATKETHALYAAIVLEEFAVYCANVLWDEAQSNRTEGQYGRTHKELPQVVNLRTEIDLKALPIAIRAKVLTMYAKINLNNVFIEDEFHETHVYSTGVYAAERGHDALDIAGDIRKHFKLKREHDALFERAVDSINQEVQRLEKLRKRNEDAMKLAAEKRQE